MHPLTTAVVYCVTGMVVEGLCAGTKTTAFMRELRQPRWGLPMSAWYVVGLVYYVLCFVTAYRMAARGGIAALGWLAVVMLANGAWNVIFFRLRNLRMSTAFYGPYAVLLGALLISAAPIDQLSAWVWVAYGAYLPYAFLWSWAVWKLNRPKGGSTTLS